MAGWAQRMITLLMMTTLAACRPFYLHPGNFVCCLSLINNVFTPSPSTATPLPLSVSPCLLRHKVCNRFCLSFLPTCCWLAICTACVRRCVCECVRATGHARRPLANCMPSTFADSCQQKLYKNKEIFCLLIFYLFNYA